MKFLKTNTLKRTVACRVPHPENLDEFVDVKFVAELRLISQAAVEALVKKVDEATGDEKDKSTQAFFDEVVIAVSEIDDETGAVKPASEESKALVREHPIACQAAAFEVFKAISEGVSRKNSKR
jgi:hypothetical protein